MITYVVYHISQDKVIFATDSKVRAIEFSLNYVGTQWPFKDGKYYFPLIIWDVYVHDKDCTCKSQCGGYSDD